MALLRRFFGNTIPFSSLNGTAVYASGFGVGDYGELRGFDTTTGQPCYSSGTFSSPCINNRTGIFTIDTRFVDYLDISVIAGNDSNGGERPNDNNESFFLITPSGSQNLLAPSRDASGLGDTNYGNTYGVWRTVRYILSASEKTTSATFRFQQFSGCSGEWRDGIPQSVRDVNQNARDRFAAQTIEVNGTVPDASIASFSINKSSICPNESVTLSWSTSNASSITIFVDGSSIGNYPASGSTNISRNTTTTYYIRANGITYYDLTGNSATSSSISVSIKPTTTGSFTSNKSTMINNGTDSVTLSWSTSNANTVSINQGIGTVAASGSRIVRPTASTSYTITAVGDCDIYTRTIPITVYQPPQTLLTLDSPTIIRGQCTTLRWITTGDAGSATISPGIGAVNINGNRQICPTTTTTYTINVSGLGGTDSDSITLIVYQPPTVDLSGPESLDYGEQGTLTFQATDADISLEIISLYSYKNTNISGNRVVLSTGQFISGTVNTQIPYNDFGPVSVTYVITATGNGGQETKSIIIPINIDETPGNILVPESEDLLKSQNPIYTPDSTVTSYEISIEDIDIPVEIKADRPILVEINDQQIWNPIRRI